MPIFLLLAIEWEEYVRVPRIDRGGEIAHGKSFGRKFRAELRRGTPSDRFLG